MTDDARQVILTGAFAGMAIGALGEAIREMAKELRRYAGSDFDKRLDALESKAIRSIENAPIDGLPENDQLFLIEKTRALMAAAFTGIRTGE